MNGELVPESDAMVHFRDRGFVYGDAAFDTSRTFGGRVFRLDDHLARLYRSLRYLRIDPGMDVVSMVRATEEVLAHNVPLLGPREDYWVTQRVSRGSNFPDEPGGRQGPTVIVETVRLPLATRACLYRDGAEIVTPSIRRVPPECLSPNAKVQNYLNMIVAGLETEGLGAHTWPILLDTRGFLAEGRGSNVFVVRGGEVLTPNSQYVLPGISRDVVMDLCRRSGIPCREADISPFDAAVADELFISSTSLCICPAASFNGQRSGLPVPGSVTRRLMDAFKEEVDFDFEAQYLSYLPA